MESNGQDNNINEESLSSARLNLISSPIKISLRETQSQLNRQEELSTPMILDAAEGKENFAVISTQFASLVQQLSKIYTEIGYSKSDITKNETKLFTAVSDTFDHFLSESIKQKDLLNKENAETTKNLKLILEILDDHTGTKTIPDLYTRNLILKPSQEKSTLLSIKKSLDVGVTYVMKRYQEVMLRYLSQCLDLNRLMERLEETDMEEMKIPKLDGSISICNLFESANSAVEIYKLISGDPKMFFENESLNDLSQRKFDMIMTQVQRKEKDLDGRISELKDLATKVIELWEILDVDYNAENPSLAGKVKNYTKSSTNFEDLNLGSTVVNEFTQLIENLQQLYDRRFEEKLSYQKQCEDLWIKLNEDPSHVEMFRQSNQSLSLHSINNYSNELQRLQDLKKLLLKDLIIEARSKIELLWDHLFYSVEEREKFTSFNEDIFTDQVLETHEAEIEALETKYESYRPILELVQQFKDLMQDKEKLEESSKDSSRLLQRNSHKILMEEEKIRKRLARQLPKMVSALSSKLNEFEQQFGTPFSFLDANLMKELKEQEQALASKGTRRVASGSSAPTRAPSRVVSRAPSAPPSRSVSRAPTRPTTRAPSRQPSRLTSRVSSRVASPTKPVPATISTNLRNPQSQGIRKPTIPTYKRPELSSKLQPIRSTQSCLLPKLSSPPKDTKLNIMPDMIRKHTTLGIRKTPSRSIPTFQRSTSSFQPQLSRLDEKSTGSPKTRSRTILSPLKESTRSNLPVMSKGNITTSPLKSLKRDGYSSEGKEPLQLGRAEELISSDEDEENDTYSKWRKEQLMKLNKPSVDLSQDTF